MKKNKMLIKTAVAVAGITLTVSILFFTPLWGTAILLSLLSGFGCYELIAATGAVRETPVCVFAVCVAAFLPWLWYFRMQSVFLPLTAMTFLSAVFLFYAMREKGGMTKTIAYVCLSAIVVPSFFSLLLPVIQEENGKRLALIPFVAAWGADTGAQLFGRLLGKHKLAPTISPNKTVEGFGGGLLFGVLCMAVYSLVLFLIKAPVPTAPLLGFGFLGACAGTVGDLFFSYVKREHGIKDFSSLMPEHGGVMDRFDSVVFVIPLFYAYIRLSPLT